MLGIRRISIYQLQSRRYYHINIDNIGICLLTEFETDLVRVSLGCKRWVGHAGGEIGAEIPNYTACWKNIDSNCDSTI